MTRIKNVTIGSDPEMFLYNEESELYVPVCGLVGGTKDNPIPITDKGHAIQEDNVAVEFCIPPCTTKEEFIDNINFVKNYINDTILKDKGLVLKSIASVRFFENDLESEQAKTFGCDPDYNAWTYSPNVINKEKVDPLLRSAGMHIHIGFDDPNPDLCIELVRAFDLFLGVPSVLIDPDTERRQLYGKAGAYRLKKYGVECRILSSYFTSNNDTIGWVFDNTLKAIEFVNNKGIITNPKDIIRAINKSDKNLALDIIEDYNIPVLNKILN